MKVAILGNGAFGTALAILCRQIGHQVCVWGHDADYTAEIARTHRNPRYLPAEIELPATIGFHAEPQIVLQRADVVLVAVPTQHVREVLAGLLAWLPARVPLISLCKGLEQSTMRRPSEVIAEIVGSEHDVLVLSGPSHAEEVAVGLPAAVVLAGRDDDVRRGLQDVLGGGNLRIYGQRDLLGVELCGALKNVMALAAGVADGLGYGDNAKAAILARGIVEMSRYGVAEGADPLTFQGIAGVGDLAVTAFSRHGRNRAFGERLGRGESMGQILASTRKVAEGVWTSRVVRARAAELGIEMPITAAVCAVLFEGIQPATAVRELMDRDLKEEHAAGRPAADRSPE